MAEYSSLDPVCKVDPSHYLGIKDLSEPLSLTSGGCLSFGGADVLDLAREYGTRCYLVDLVQVTKNSKRLVESFTRYPANFRPFYAVKANSSEPVVESIVKEGFGIEVTNIHELLFAVETLDRIGRNRDKVSIVCNGVSKNYLQRPYKKTLIETAFELQERKGYDVSVNLSSIEEIRHARKVAEKNGWTPRVGVRINPGITLKTSEDLATGAGYSRFGITLGRLDDAINEIIDKNLMRLVQLHCHIGSQISDIGAISGTFAKSRDEAQGEIPVLCSILIGLEKKYGVHVEKVNIGGGIGVKYVKTEPRNLKEYGEFWPNYDIEEYASRVSGMFKTIKEESGLEYRELCIEPGRWLTANTTVLLLTVTDTFDVQDNYRSSLKGSNKWIITDGSAMTDTHDTVLLQQWFEIINVSRIGRPLAESYNIGGVACDSGDVFAWGRDRTGPRILPRTEQGDVLMVLDVGAYQQSLSSNYNMLPTAPAFHVGGSRKKKTVK